MNHGHGQVEHAGGPAKVQPPSSDLQVCIEHPEHQQRPRQRTHAPKHAGPLQWRSRASNFLHRMPQNDEAWESRLPSPAAVRRLCDQLVLAHIAPTQRAAMTWNELLSACCQHQARVHETTRPFFELVFVATCFLALKEGHGENEVNQSMRQFGERGRSASADHTLARMRSGCVRGIELLSVVARHQGARALALPYYDLPCLTLFEHCTPECLRYVEANVPRINQAAHIAFEELFIPRLVYHLLGGDACELSYGHICSVLGTATRPPTHSTEQQTFSNLDMNDILTSEF